MQFCCMEGNVPPGVVEIILVRTRDNRRKCLYLYSFHGNHSTVWSFRTSKTCTNGCSSKMTHWCRFTPTPNRNSPSRQMKRRCQRQTNTDFTWGSIPRMHGSAGENKRLLFDVDETRTTNERTSSSLYFIIVRREFS